MQQTNRKLLWLEIIGFILVSALAVPFHFLYEWSGENAVVGLFSPINESVWEHTKLLFYPYLLYSLLECSWMKVEPLRYLAAKAMGLLVGVGFVIAFFYTYSGILGYSIMWVDIGSAFLTIALMFFVSYRILHSKRKWEKAGIVLALLVVVVILVMSLWSFSAYTPSIALFTPPK